MHALLTATWNILYIDSIVHEEISDGSRAAIINSAYFGYYRAI
jgi:hypothetical protein